MSRSRTGNIVMRNGHPYARVTYMGLDGKRKGIWRAAKNITHARQLIPQIIEMIGHHRGQPREPRRRGFIYAVRMETPPPVTAPIKIGFAIDVRSRLKALITAVPYPLTLLGFWQTANGLIEERTMHQAFADHRLRGEWFESSDELITAIHERTEQYRARLRDQAQDLDVLLGKCSEFVTAEPILT